MHISKNNSTFAALFVEFQVYEKDTDDSKCLLVECGGICGGGIAGAASGDAAGRKRGDGQFGR